MNKMLIGFIVFALIIAATAWFSYNAGYNSCSADHAKDIAEEGKKDDEKVKTVIEYKEKLKVVYRDKIKYIKSVKDTTGCADTKLINMGFGLQ